MKKIRMHFRSASLGSELMRVDFQLFCCISSLGRSVAHPCFQASEPKRPSLITSAVSLKRSEPPPRSVCHNPAHTPKILLTFNYFTTLSHIA